MRSSSSLSWRSSVLVAFAPVLLVAPALLCSHHDALACGGFFARGPDVPALEVEQTLIVHDPVKQVEHFIREVSFRKGNVAFGFVVPTSSRPEVAKVDDAPFRRLREAFPFAARRSSFGLGGGSGWAQAGPEPPLHEASRCSRIRSSEASPPSSSLRPMPTA
jgi:hypothetical protein